MNGRDDRRRWTGRGGAAAAALAAAAAAAVWLAGAGCSVDEGTMGANRPPETVLTHVGAVDTVNSHVRLEWWGSDADGEVIGYEYRWSFGDTGWTFTTATTDSFVVPAPSGTSAHTFEVRAVDDRSAVDPSPATQEYRFSNAAPSIAFLDPGALPSESLPAVTVGFVVTDPNGDDTVAKAVAWLDGEDPATAGREIWNPQRPDRPAFPDTSITFRPEDFAGLYARRTIFIQGVDDAGAVSEVDSHSVYIVEPEGRVLVVDDMPDNIAGWPITDAFYTEAMDEIMGGEDQYTLHKISQGAIRTPEEASAIFSLFEVVIWYQGTNANLEPYAPVSTLSLRNAEQAIREHLGAGGKMLLVTMNAIGTQGAFAGDFVREVLGVESVVVNPDLPEDDTNFFLKTFYYNQQPTWFIEGRGDGVYEDVRVMGSFWGLELFDATPGADILYTVPEEAQVFAGQSAKTVATRVGVGPGTMVFLGFPLSRCTYPTDPAGPPPWNKEVIRAILARELGLP